MSDRQGSLDAVELDVSTVRGTEGFYRVGKSTAGRWWLVRPDGRPMLYKGCNAVIRQAMGKAGDNAYFRWVEQEYGDDFKRFIGDAVTALTDAGFNGFGGWSFLFTPREGHREVGLPFVEIISGREIVGKECCALTPGRRDPATGERKWGVLNLDVFDPRVADRLEGYSRENCAELRDNPNLLGYYADNECTYGQPHTDAAWTGKLEDLQTPPPAATLLQCFLVMEPDRPGHRGAWDWVLARHGGSITTLARDWGLAFSDPAELRRLTDEEDIIITTPGYSIDHEAFTHLYVRKFYGMHHDIIRRYDPHHLIMTTRHPAPPGLHVLRSVRECFDLGLVDVLAMNNYRIEFRDRLEEFYGPTQMPILNGEFSWCAGGFLDWGKYRRCEMFNEEEKEGVRIRARVALENAFAHPSLIGYTWFKWYSGAEFTEWEYGLATDQPFGAVVNNAGKLNTFNAPLFRELHPRLEGIATGAIEPTRVPGLKHVPQHLD